MKYTREQIEAVYEEAGRRMYLEARDGTFEDDFDRREYRKAMLQGVYSALIATATNWPEVANWCREIEKRLGL